MNPPPLPFLIEIDVTAALDAEWQTLGEALSATFGYPSRLREAGPTEGWAALAEYLPDLTAEQRIVLDRRSSAVAAYDNPAITTRRSMRILVRDRLATAALDAPRTATENALANLPPDCPSLVLVGLLSHYSWTGDSLRDSRVMGTHVFVANHDTHWALEHWFNYLLAEWEYTTAFGGHYATTVFVGALVRSHHPDTTQYCYWLCLDVVQALGRPTFRPPRALLALFPHTVQQRLLYRVSWTDKMVWRMADAVQAVTEWAAP
jgi:hypothetical protein